MRTISESGTASLPYFVEMVILPSGRKTGSALPSAKPPVKGRPAGFGSAAVATEATVAKNRDARIERIIGRLLKGFRDSEHVRVIGREVDRHLQQGEGEALPLGIAPQGSARSTGQGIVQHEVQSENIRRLESLDPACAECREVGRDRLGREVRLQPFIPGR